MQITPAPTNAPSRIEEPPGTSLIRDDGSSGLSGSVSLSRNGTRGSGPATGAISPQRKPTRMPRLTQVFTVHPVGESGSGTAARMRPDASSVRKAANTVRAASRSASAPAAYRRSMVVASGEGSAVTVAFSVAGAAPRSKTAGIFPRCAVSWPAAASLRTGLGATRDVRHRLRTRRAPARSARARRVAAGPSADDSGARAARDAPSPP